MIAWVDDKIFALGEVRDVDRLVLLRNAERRRHTLIVSRDPDEAYGERNAPLFKEWLKGLQTELHDEVSMLCERLDLLSANAVTRGANRILVTNGPSPQADGCHVTLPEAIRTVSLPLQLLVEHMVHDAAFLRRVLPPVWRNQLDEWERGGLLSFENGGGNTVITAMVRHFTDDGFARSATGLPAEIWRLVHFVIYDHDGTRRQSPGDNAKKLKRACKDRDMESRSHMLERRDQEHYLPPEALRKVFELCYEDQPVRAKNELELNDYLALPLGERSFKALPKAGREAFCKNAFFNRQTEFVWLDAWFEDDGAWPEMTRLAEAIAAAI